MPPTVQPRDLVEARLYASEEDVIQDAIEHLLRDRPELRIAVAVHLYQHDEGWTVGGAAQLAGVTLWDMLRILREHNVEPRIGPASVEEAGEDAATIRRWLNE